MAITLRELAELVNGQLHGDGALPVQGADILRDARSGDISFVESERYLETLKNSHAIAVLLPRGMATAEVPFICVDDVHAAFAQVVGCFRNGRQESHAGISTRAIISPTARLDENVTVHPLAVVGENVRLGSGTIVHSGVCIMSGCQIGKNVELFPNTTLYENTVVGDRSLIHAGAVIGAYGFGYSTVEGRHQRSAQLGNVQIGEDVEIGACTTIDRGTYGSTVIGDGTKIDNQVMIGHNCRIGRHNMICSQVGIAGSTTTGDYVVMAGQVGVRDHVHIGSQAMLGAKAGVMSNIPEGESYVGIPATPERKQLLIQASIMRLPDMKKQVKELQRMVERLEAESASRCQEAA